MPDDPVSRLVLGTVQLGMDYGIANRTGRPSRDQADEILLLAHGEGIRLLDTAQAYGDSEAVIGDFLRRHPHCDFAIVSKLDPGIDVADGDAIMAAVRRSRRQVGRNLEAILVHDAAALGSWHGALGRALRRCVDEGWVGALGVSIYAPEELEAALDIEEIGVIQAPFNVLDRRIADGGLLERALRMGKRMLLRSAFLQGLLVMQPESLPPHMAFARDTLSVWRDLCTTHDLKPEEAALRYVRAVAPAAEIVIGCETIEQLESNLKILEVGPAAAEFNAAIVALPTASERMIDPSQWTVR